MPCMAIFGCLSIYTYVKGSKKKDLNKKNQKNFITDIGIKINKSIVDWSLNLAFIMYHSKVRGVFITLHFTTHKVGKNAWRH